MRILVSSYAFSPSVGGIEHVSEVLAEEFTRSGHEVRVITRSADADGKERSFRVIRCPRWYDLWSLHKWAQVVFCNHLSMRFVWPKLFGNKPCIVTTQTWISGSFGQETIVSRMKRLVLQKCRNVAVSDAIAKHVGIESVILGNPYDHHTFRCLPDVERRSELLFVGRIVSDKGLDVLLRALVRLRETGVKPCLTIIGDGPERLRCETLVCDANLGGQVRFVGVVRGQELARLMNAHRILVVPSRWPEPFGVVALEGIACGCVIVGSEDGGLREAIGRCGLTFRNGDDDALAAALKVALVDSSIIELARKMAPSHLAKFHVEAIGRAYLELFMEELR